VSREEMRTMAQAERALESNDYEALLALEEKVRVCTVHNMHGRCSHLRRVGTLF
jgi:hypothetical protein